MISLIIYSTVYCFLPPVICCMTFIPASPLRSSRNRRWLPWLKSSAADSSRDKVCHFLRLELLTGSRVNGCVKNQAQMCTVSNNHRPLLCEVRQSISCLLLNGWDHTKRSYIVSNSCPAQEWADSCSHCTLWPVKELRCFKGFILIRLGGWKCDANTVTAMFHSL